MTQPVPPAPQPGLPPSIAPLDRPDNAHRDVILPPGGGWGQYGSERIPRMRPPTEGPETSEGVPLVPADPGDRALPGVDLGNIHVRRGTAPDPATTVLGTCGPTTGSTTQTPRPPATQHPGRPHPKS
jgi:hypothetical protein